MGVAEGQKLVIKNSFLEYDIQVTQSPSVQPMRPRSWTEPPCIEKMSYGQVREVFHGSDSSSSNEESKDAAIVMAPMVTSTPEPSPLVGPSHCPPRHMNFLLQQAGLAPLAGNWDGSETWSEEYNNMNWWAPMPYPAYSGTSGGYGDANNRDQFANQSTATNQTEDSAVRVSTPHMSAKLAPIAELATEVNTVVQGDLDPAKESRTTVMLRGLPETFTRAAVLKLLGDAGFFGRFNFVYLPVDFKRHKNLGYALINLVSPKEALRLGKHFEGFSSWDVKGGSACTVAWCSPQQGLQAHVDRYRNSPVMHESVPEEWRPMLLSHGVAVTFPPPTIKIKAPRLKGLQ